MLVDVTKKLAAGWNRENRCFQTCGDQRRCCCCHDSTCVRLDSRLSLPTSSSFFKSVKATPFFVVLLLQMQKSVRMDKAPHLPEENQTHHHQKIIAPKSELAIEPNPSCSPHNTFNSILFTHSNNRLQGAAATHEIAASQTDRKTTTTSWVGGFSLLSRNSDLETTTTTTNKMVESSSPSSSSSFSAAAPSSSDTLEIAALKVLYAEDPWTKAEYGDVAARLWLDGSIQFPYLHDSALPPVPRRPARLPTVQLVAPKDMPKLGKGGSLRSRQALLHSLVHTESWAIDLSWDIIARFGKAESMPREFFDDFVKVAQDEGRHFQLLATRLGELGSSYGALPAHDGLWDSAEATAHDLSARLVVEHCVHEARGLDVLPTTISRFRKGGDDLTADLLESVIYPEEITHCAAGQSKSRIC
ncbi:hypothetical protein CY35_03G102300 [Sphagnum magellanicum]|nr:hypothetical protein CY35_03G102300 [Sphagnum magellanicum]